MADRALLIAIVLVVLPCIAARCGGLKTIVIDEPIQGALVDDSTVVAAARVGTNFDELTAQVRIDGVDLIAAFALVPPFQDEAGVVMIGPDLVTVTGFTFTADPGAPRVIALSAAGLPTGPHLFEVEADLANGQGAVLRGTEFEQTGVFSLEVAGIAVSGLRNAPVAAGAEGVLVNAVLGSPLAARPVGLTGGGELRPGPMPAAEARINGGTP